MAGRLAVLVPGAFTLLVISGTTAQALVPGCQEQHCEPLLLADGNRLR
jgi:hypothetical protein